MPQSLGKIILHTVFSTKDRRPLLRDKTVRASMHSYLGGILNELGCDSLGIGGVEDHVHLLATLSRTCTVAEMVKEVKRGSSIWIKTQGSTFSDFAWQNGYGTFSIGFSQTEAARRYIRDQERHHQKLTFQDEYRLFLKKYAVQYDERFVWD